MRFAYRTVSLMPLAILLASCVAAPAITDADAQRFISDAGLHPASYDVIAKQYPLQSVIDAWDIHAHGAPREIDSFCLRPDTVLSASVANGAKGIITVYRRRDFWSVQTHPCVVGDDRDYIDGIEGFSPESTANVLRRIDAFIRSRGADQPGVRIEFDENSDRDALAMVDITRLRWIGGFPQFPSVGFAMPDGGDIYKIDVTLHGSEITEIICHRRTYVEE